MRPLTVEELDSILGGVDYTTTTLDTVQVTAPRINNTGGFYIGGDSRFTYDETVGCGSSCNDPSYWANIGSIPAASVPSINKLNCLKGVGANTWVSTFKLMRQNDYAFYNPSSTPTQGGMAFNNINSSPGTYPSYTQGAGAFTFSTQNPTTGVWSGTTYIYAAGMTGYAGSITWQNPTTGQTGTMSGPFTATEWIAATLHHEMQHQRYNGGRNPTLNAEAIANYYAMTAVLAVRAGQASHCPAS